jgi:hypothetical protein
MVSSVVWQEVITELYWKLCSVGGINIVNDSLSIQSQFPEGVNFLNLTELYCSIIDSSRILQY